MTRRSSIVRGVVALVFSLALAPLAHAAETRAVRLTLLQGAVTVDPMDGTGAQPAQLNLPLLAGVHVATGADGQAEIEFEDGSVVRLTPNSALSLDTLAVDAEANPARPVFTTGLSLLHGLAYLE